MYLIRLKEKSGISLTAHPLCSVESSGLERLAYAMHLTILQICLYSDEMKITNSRMFHSESFRKNSKFCLAKDSMSQLAMVMYIFQTLMYPDKKTATNSSGEKRLWQS